MSKMRNNIISGPLFGSYCLNNGYLRPHTSAMELAEAVRHQLSKYTVSHWLHKKELIAMKPKMLVSLTRVLLVRDHRDLSTPIEAAFS